MRLSAALLVVLVCSACGRSDEPAAVSNETIVRTFSAADREANLRLIEEMKADRRPEYEGLLVANLAHDDRWVREFSAHALGDLGFRSAGTIAALIYAFDDEDDWVRWKAVRALGLIGPAAKRALPSIEPAATAKQEVEVVRAAAQVAVKRIRGE